MLLILSPGSLLALAACSCDITPLSVPQGSALGMVPFFVFSSPLISSLFVPEVIATPCSGFPAPLGPSYPTHFQ